MDDLESVGLQENPSILESGKNGVINIQFNSTTHDKLFLIKGGIKNVFIKVNCIYLTSFESKNIMITTNEEETFNVAKRIQNFLNS